MSGSPLIEMDPENQVELWEERLTAVWMHGEVPKGVRQRLYAELQASAFVYELTPWGYPRVAVRPENIEEGRLALETLRTLTVELEEQVVLARHEQFCRLCAGLVAELEDAIAHLQRTYDRVVKGNTARPEAWKSRLHKLLKPYGRVGGECVQVEVSAAMHPQVWHAETVHAYRMLTLRVISAEPIFRAFVPKRKLKLGR